MKWIHSVLTADGLHLFQVCWTGLRCQQIAAAVCKTMPNDKHVKIVTYRTVSTKIGLLEAHLHFFVSFINLRRNCDNRDFVFLWWNKACIV